MNRPMTEPDCVRKALEPYGFKDGRYGDVPFKVSHSAFTHKGDFPGGHYHVLVDDRVIAEVGIGKDGTYPVRMQMSAWLKGAVARNPDVLDAMLTLLKPEQPVFGR
jgi:hypothetical protein